MITHTLGYFVVFGSIPKYTLQPQPGRRGMGEEIAEVMICSADVAVAVTTLRRRYVLRPTRRMESSVHIFLVVLQR